MVLDAIGWGGFRAPERARARAVTSASGWPISAKAPAAVRSRRSPCGSGRQARCTSTPAPRRWDRALKHHAGADRRRTTRRGMANITVTAGDTAGIAMGIGGFNSRQAVIAGSSAHLAALKVREKALTVAGQDARRRAPPTSRSTAATVHQGPPQDRKFLGADRARGGRCRGLSAARRRRTGLEATEAFRARRHDLTPTARPSPRSRSMSKPAACHVGNFVIAHDCGR